MKFNRHSEAKEAEFDLTAMIDVVLLLIIFFMLSAQFARVQLRPVDLPQQPGEPASPAAPALDQALIVDMAADGKLSVIDLGEVSPEQLAGIVEKHKLSSGGRADGLEVLIRADRTCAALHLNRLAGVLGRAGVKNWKLATTGGGSGAGAAGAGGGA